MSAINQPHRMSTALYQPHDGPSPASRGTMILSSGDYNPVYGRPLSTSFTEEHDPPTDMQDSLCKLEVTFTYIIVIKIIYFIQFKARLTCVCVCVSVCVLGEGTTFYSIKRLQKDRHIISHRTNDWTHWELQEVLQGDHDPPHLMTMTRPQRGWSQPIWWWIQHALIEEWLVPYIWIRTCLNNTIWTRSKSVLSETESPLLNGNQP